MINVLEHQRIQPRLAPPPRRVSPRQDAPPAEVLAVIERAAARRPGAPAGLAARLSGWLRLESLFLPVLGLGLASLLVLSGLGRTRQQAAASLPLPADRAYEMQLAGTLLPEEPAAERLGDGVVESLRVVAYEVKAGDTISRIAERFSLNLDTILSYNDIRDVRRLTAGSVLQIPSTDGLKHRVARGEYLGGIAARYGVPLNRLLDWNDLDSSLIQPGQYLFIPGARLRTQDLNRILGRLFIYPAAGRISSRFGMRPDPFTGVRRFHNGVDIANDPGTGVSAAMAGRVAMTGYNASYGKYVIISHPEGYQTLYGHLDSFLVRRGQSVAQGQDIGAMGNTGYSTGPHLHFSIFQGGEPVDPFKFLH